MTTKEAKKLRHLADLADDALLARRLRGVALVLEGRSISAAAREVGMDRARLSFWCARHREHGLGGLEDQRQQRGGLTDEQEERLQVFVVQRRPTTADVIAWLRDELGLSYSPNGARNLLLAAGAHMPNAAARSSNRRGLLRWYIRGLEPWR